MAGYDIPALDIPLATKWRFPRSREDGPRQNRAADRQEAVRQTRPNSATPQYRAPQSNSLTRLFAKAGRALRSKLEIEESPSEPEQLRVPAF